jgi:hypothetical protein
MAITPLLLRFGLPVTAVPRREFRERPYRDGSPAADAEGDGEESEPLARKTAKVAEVLDDEHSGSKEPRPSLRREVGGVVDVPEIDADEGGPATNEEIGYLDVKVRPGLPISPGPQRSSQPVRMMTALSLIAFSSSSSVTAPD